MDQRRSPDSVPSKPDALVGMQSSSENMGLAPSIPADIESSASQQDCTKENPFAKRTDQKALESARSRFLARQRAKQSH